MELSNSVPMRWPSGPLEIARREKSVGFSTQARQVIGYWHTPPSLDILQGSPVNCLVVNWAAGLAEDSEQQRTIRPLVDAARQRNLAVVGWVEGESDAKAAIAAAQAAGLAAVAIQGFSGKSEFPVIPWGSRSKAPWDTTAPVMAVTENVWPGVQALRDAATAGPTAVPWLDSNAWFARLAQARTQAQIWMLFDPPGKGVVVPSRSYQLAVCDAETSGGRWVISLDDDLRAGLAEKNPTAAATLKLVSEAVSFFQKHREWKKYRSLGAIGVISDFKGENFEFSGELLNLMSRRDLLYRVLWNLGRDVPNLAGLKAAIWADRAKPTAQVRSALLNFVQQGGLLITGPKWGAEGAPRPSEYPRFELRALGKGRIAMAKEELADPWVFTVDAQQLLSHANDVAKLFNARASGGFNYGASPDGKRALLQLVSYSTGGGRGSASNATAWTRHKYKSAQVWTIEAEKPTGAPVVPAEDGGTEYQLPGVPAYLALDLEV